MTFQVKSSNDDAEERISNGRVNLSSTDLEITSDRRREQIVGIRFDNLAVPQGATILNAYMEFTVDERSSETTNLTFYGEDNNNALEFSDSDFDISSRTKTSSSVPWSNVPAWNTVGSMEQSPDLTAIIQEIVDRGDWSNGNSLAIIIEGTGERIAESYDGSQVNAPKLVIEIAETLEPCYALNQNQTGNLVAWFPSGGYYTIGVLGVNEVEALVLNGACDELLSANEGDFGSVDLTTGEFNLIGALGTVNNTTLGPHTISDVDGLAIDDRSGLIYASERVVGANDLFFLIDPAIGSVVVNAFGLGVDYVPIPGPNPDIDDLAFNPCTGELFGVSTFPGGMASDIIVRIDITTGSTTIVATTNECDIEGLTFDNNCVLYASTGNVSCLSDGTIYEVDIATGALTEISNLGGDVEGIACCIDAPLRSPLGCTIELTEENCTDGTAVAEALPVGGFGGYTYEWSHSPTTAIVSDLFTGSYTLTVSDFSGTTSTCSIIVSPPSLTCSTERVSEVECNMPNSGSALVIASGGAPAYSYLWDNAETTDTAFNLTVGEHFVTVTDSDNCSVSCTIEVEMTPPQCTKIFSNGFVRTNRF